VKRPSNLPRLRYQPHWNKRPVMNNPTIHQPLSDDELNRLGGFLDEIGPLAMNMESEHGIA
jgi:hypothetical protein